MIADHVNVVDCTELGHHVIDKYVASPRWAHTPSLLCLRGQTRAGHTGAHPVRHLLLSVSRLDLQVSGWRGEGPVHAEALVVDDG